MIFFLGPGRFYGVMPSEDRCELKCLSAIGKRNRSSLALKVSPLSIKPGVGPIESGVKFEIELECRGFDFIGFWLG